MAIKLTVGADYGASLHCGPFSKAHTFQIETPLTIPLHFPPNFVGRQTNRNSAS